MSAPAAAAAAELTADLDDSERPTPTRTRAAAAHRAADAARRAIRAGRLAELLHATDGTHALITGFTAAQQVLTVALADLELALANLKQLRKDEIAASADANKEERPAADSADRS